MPNWTEILGEINACGSAHDVVRRMHLRNLHEVSGRNVVVYYSGWLQKRGLQNLDINDADKNGFMTVLNKLDRTKGLDLILHTPGGETAATESLVDYLRSMFGSNVRAIIPQLALSAGTMIACACSEIVMGKHSSLGPIDPQFGGIPAHGIVEEFKRAHTEIRGDQSKVFVWQPIIAKYAPTFIGECEKAIKWCDDMVREWLRTGMLRDDPDRDTKINRIMEELADHAISLSHSRHLSAIKCKDLGLRIFDLESDDALQDAVLSVHHSCIHTLTSTAAYKLIENHEGIASINQARIA